MATELLIVGPTGAGKTTLANMLVSSLNERGYKAEAVKIHLNHGLTYAFTRFLVKLKKIKYRQNFFLSLRLGNPELFKRSLWFLLLLEIVSLPVIMFMKETKLKLKKVNYVIFDEFVITSIADYSNFISHAGSKTLFFANAYWTICNSILVKKLKNKHFITVVLYCSVSDSIARVKKRDNVYSGIREVCWRYTAIRFLLSLFKLNKTLNYDTSGPNASINLLSFNLLTQLTVDISESP